MRLYHKTGKLSSNQISRLQEVGFNFDVQESLWNTRCEELAAYKEAHGDFFVPYASNPVRSDAWSESSSKLRKIYNCLDHSLFKRHCISGRTIKSGDTIKANSPKSTPTSYWPWDSTLSKALSKLLHLPGNQRPVSKSRQLESCLTAKKIAISTCKTCGNRITKNSLPYTSSGVIATYRSSTKKILHLVRGCLLRNSAKRRTSYQPNVLRSWK